MYVVNEIFVCNHLSGFEVVEHNRVGGVGFNASFGGPVICGAVIPPVPVVAELHILLGPDWKKSFPMKLVARIDKDCMMRHATAYVDVLVVITAGRSTKGCVVHQNFNEFLQSLPGQDVTGTRHVAFVDSFVSEAMTEKE